MTLVRAKKENGQITECSERTGMWAWKHVHQADGSVDYIELKGDVVFDDVDFGYNPDKIVLHNVDLLLLQDRRSLSLEVPVPENNDHKPDQPVLRYSGWQDPLRRH